MAKHTYTFSEHGGDTQMRKADSHDPFRFDKSAHKNIVADSRCPRSGSDTVTPRNASRFVRNASLFRRWCENGDEGSGVRGGKGEGRGIVPADSATSPLSLPASPPFCSSGRSVS